MSYRFNPLISRHLDMHDSVPGVLDSRYLKLTGSLAEVTNHSHTVLSDIGTNTHAQIDSHISGTGTAVHGLGTMSLATETNYALLAGRAGGQTLIGGTAITDTLKLQGTSGNGTLTAIAIQGLVGNNGATVAFTVLNNGNVGIGTTSPGYKLQVWDGDVDFSDGTTGMFYQDSTKRLGLGTNAPNAQLDIYNSGGATFRMSGTTGATRGVHGVIDFFNSYSPSSNVQAEIKAYSTTAGGKAGELGFFTAAPTTGTLTEQVTINSSGNFGIGTTSPDRLVHAEVVNTTTNAVSYGLRLTHICSTASTGLANGGGVGIEFELETATDTTNQIAATIESAWVDSTNATRKGNLSLYAYDTAARLGIQVAANGSVATLGFYGVTPVVRPTALTAQLTTVTCSAPGTPDYAIADLTQTLPYGFASADEGQSVLKVIANLQTRCSELETKLQGLGILT